MKRDFLTKELGLSKEMTDKIMAQYGESVNSLKAEQERLLKENENLQERVLTQESNLTLMEQLKTKNTELEENIGKLTKELDNSKIDGVLSASLLSAGAKNLKAVSALIDKSKITFENGEVRGLTEQIDIIRGECDYLFHQDSQSSGMRHISSQNLNDGFTSFARAAAKID